MFNLIIILLTIFTLTCSHATTQCGQIFTEKTFVITSPEYPSTYPNSPSCFYLLKGPKNCTENDFEIEFLDFDVFESTGCVTDRLEIGSQDALCGDKKGIKKYKSESRGHLKVKFVAESGVEKGRRRGFRLLVTRVDRCGGEEMMVTDSGDVGYVTDYITDEPATTSKKPPQTYLPPPPQPCCQKNTFSSKSFHLVSPYFPYSTANPTDCTFIIKKSNPSVCRLRINLLFFNLGGTGSNSYIDIDGKQLYGCKSDLRLTTEFDGKKDFKLVRFVSKGVEVSGVEGFVLEVMQDECQKLYEGQRARRPRQADIQALKLLNEKSFYLSDEDTQKHFYFFGPENEQDITWTGQDREEIDSVDLSTIENHASNYQECLNWNLEQLKMLQNQFGRSLYARCEVLSSVESPSRCLVLDALSGRFRSPGYPLGYPMNQDICFRFQFASRFCQIEIYFEDFQLESSFDCLKDYLLLDKNRYCGTYLSNKKVLISRKAHQLPISAEDVKFISDANYCGKGFSAFYRQLRCQHTPKEEEEEEEEENSIIRPDRCLPMGKTDPDCRRRVISDDVFVINSQELLGRVCRWEVNKYKEDVCKVEFYLRHFNLPCPFASLEINGITLCGERTGQNLSLNIDRTIEVVYRGSQVFRGAFLVQGRQIADCGYSIPDPVRLIAKINNNNPTFSNSTYQSKLY